MTTTIGQPRTLAQIIAIRNEVERIEQITWLKRFLLVWEKDIASGEHRHNMLCNLYCAWVDSKGLPQQCAEDTIFYLRNYNEDSI